MPRIFLLLLLLLLVPASAFADALEAAALGQALPMIFAMLLVGVVIGITGITVAMNDFYSAQENPRWLNMVLIGLGVVAGTFFSLMAQLGNHHSYRHHTNLFPNVLTEIYVPLALLLIALKKFRFAQNRSSLLFWLGVMAAWIMVLISGVTGLLFLADSFIEPSLATMLGVALILGAWILLFKKYGRQALPPDEPSGPVWQVPVVGAGLAALYASAIQLLCSLFAGELQDYDFGQLIAAESVYFLMCLMLGGLVLFSISITHSRINHN